MLSYTHAQIGAKTPYSAQIVRLVKPTFRPIGFSPRARRRRRISALARYAASVSKPGSRPVIGPTIVFPSSAASSSVATASVVMGCTVLCHPARPG